MCFQGEKWTCPLKMWFLLVLTMKMMKQQVGRGGILILVTLGVEKGLVPPVEAIGSCKKSKCVFSRREMDLSSEIMVFACFDNEDDEATRWEGCHSHPCDLNRKVANCSKLQVLFIHAGYFILEVI